MDKKSKGKKKTKEKPSKYQPPVNIPLDFDAAVSGLLKVKPDSDEEKKSEKKKKKK